MQQSCFLKYFKPNRGLSMCVVMNTFCGCYTLQLKNWWYNGKEISKLFNPDGSFMAFPHIQLLQVCCGIMMMVWIFPGEKILNGWYSFVSSPAASIKNPPFLNYQYSLHWKSKHKGLGNLCPIPLPLQRDCAQEHY